MAHSLMMCTKELCQRQNDLAIISPVSLFSTVPVLVARTLISCRRSSAVGLSGTEAVRETRAVSDSSWIFSVVINFLKLVNMVGPIELEYVRLTAGDLAKENPAWLRFPVDKSGTTT